MNIKTLPSFLFFLLALLLFPSTRVVGENEQHVLNILDLGGKNDGSEDISAIVNKHTAQGTIFLPAGIYKVSSPIKLQNPLKGDGYSRTGKRLPTYTWLISEIECEDGSMGVVEYPEETGVVVENLNIACHSREDGIRIKPCRQKTLTRVDHVGVFNVRGVGIRVEGNGSRPVFLEDLTIFGNSNHPMGSTAIIIGANDCRLTNIEAMGIQIGLVVHGAYTYGCNLHLWTGDMGPDDGGEWWKGTRGIVLMNGGCFCGSQIYPDTSYYVFEQRKGTRGGFEISEFMYYDDGSERKSRYLDGELYHAEEGTTPNLHIQGGIMSVCGTDEKPLGMTRMYTPGQKIDNVIVRTDRSICGKNIDVICLSDALPDYTVEYADKGWCRVGDIFNMAPQGTVTAHLSADNGAVWQIKVEKNKAGKVKVKFQPENRLCKDFKLKYMESDDMIRLFLLTPNNNPIKVRFTTEVMNPYFRPVDYGNLRRHDFSQCYRQVLEEWPKANNSDDKNESAVPTVKKVTAEATEMRYGDPSRHDYLFAKDPTVIRIGKQYYMYYSQDPMDKDKRPAGVNGEVANWHCGVAKSKDMINWTRVSDIKLYNTKGEEIGYDAAPCVKSFDGQIYLFYQRVYQPIGQNVIWLAKSKDGVTFTNVFDEPIFIPKADWCIHRAIDPEVYRVKDKMVMMFATRENPTKKIQQIGMAEAPYGSDYGPDKWTELSIDGPIFKPEMAWEKQCIEAPTVVEVDGIYYFFYAGDYNHGGQQIGLATSTDGYHFTRVNYFPDAPGLFYPLGPTGSWNAAESGHPGVFKDKDDRVYLFYQGKASGKKTADPYLLSVLKLNFE